MLLYCDACRCTCKDGYEGNGITCTDINECAEENDCDSRVDRGICTNTVGSYLCSCAEGFTITSSNICEDIDECQDPGMFFISTFDLKCVRWYL